MSSPIRPGQAKGPSVGLGGTSGGSSIDHIHASYDGGTPTGGISLMNFQGNVCITDLGTGTANVLVNEIAVDEGSTPVSSFLRKIVAGAGLGATDSGMGEVLLAMKMAISKELAAINANTQAMDISGPGVHVGQDPVTPGQTNISIDALRVAVSGITLDSEVVEENFTGNGFSIISTGAGKVAIRNDAPAVTDGTTTVDPTHTLRFANTTATQVGLDRVDLTVGMPLEVDGASKNPIMQGINLCAGSGISIGSTALTLGASSLTLTVLNAASAASIITLGAEWRLNATINYPDIDMEHYEGGSWVRKGGFSP
jgi:hypothetical protein